MLYKRTARVFLRLLYVATAAATVVACYAALGKLEWAGKAISTTGYILALTGLSQLDVSGLFEKLNTAYDDLNLYPYGPPSHVTRELIDNPDRPVRTFIRNKLERDPRTGFLLVVTATVFQLIGTILT